MGTGKRDWLKEEEEKAGAEEKEEGRGGKRSRKKEKGLRLCGCRMREKRMSDVRKKEEKDNVAKTSSV